MAILRRNCGFTMLEMLLAFVILAMFTLALSSQLSFGFRGIASVEKRRDLDSIRSYIEAATSCGATIPNLNGTCTAGPIALQRDTGAGPADLVIIPSGTSITRMGDYALRAACAPSLKGVTVEAARLKPNALVNSNRDSDFLPDPLTGRIVKWGDPKASLFPAGVELCTGAKQNVGAFHSHSSHFGGVVGGWYVAPNVFVVLGGPFIWNSIPSTIVSGEAITFTPKGRRIVVNSLVGIGYNSRASGVGLNFIIEVQQGSPIGESWPANMADSVDHFVVDIKTASTSFPVVANTPVTLTPKLRVQCTNAPPSWVCTDDLTVHPGAGIPEMSVWSPVGITVQEYD